MKRISTLLLFLLTLLTGYAQNPFATYGYKPKMATLSNGRFDEFHDKDRIIEIGSVKFDTKTNKIIGLAESDTLDTGLFRLIPTQKGIIQLVHMHTVIIIR